MIYNLFFIGRSHLYPIVGHSSFMSNVWKLNINSCFNLSGPLPYDKVIYVGICVDVNYVISVIIFDLFLVFFSQDLYEPQSRLLSYVLEQPYSRDMICSMLVLNKQVSIEMIVADVLLNPWSWVQRSSPIGNIFLIFFKILL